ncbi:hypothetical protein HHI36_020917 [Cryptolaemus montrouzieri]|uniref:Fat storage-inducing transmembrane protein n=1 Tax=Cryptolaemus montrouzieri TaxID=559131 RepID=A0ABD2NCS3_9CUCU
MAFKRKTTSSTPLNFRPNMSDANVEPKGTKPTREATTVSEILTLMVIFLCKKILFLERRLKIIIYLGCLFGISLVADVMPIPRWYFSRSDNIINRFFVKFAWGWNLFLVIPFLVLTCYIYCCGQKRRIATHHLLRLFIATFFWWFWTKLFNVIEANFGRCISKGYNTKGTCLHAGHVWNGFDISGHCFILIYGSLLLIEETRCMMNWDGIKDYIRLEEHQRSFKDNSVNSNPLRNLSDEEFVNLQINYVKYTPYIRGLFIAITCLQVMWDFMLLTTMLYYHVMVEKLIGGIIAIMTWFLTYHIWYRFPKVLPVLPGEGVFKYIKDQITKAQFPVARRRIGNIVNNQVPTFMGRPIYRQNQETNQDGEGNR